MRRRSSSWIHLGRWRQPPASVRRRGSTRPRRPRSSFATTRSRMFPPAWRRSRQNSCPISSRAPISMHSTRRSRTRSGSKAAPAVSRVRGQRNVVRPARAASQPRLLQSEDPASGGSPAHRRREWRHLRDDDRECTLPRHHPSCFESGPRPASQATGAAGLAHRDQSRERQRPYLRQRRNARTQLPSRPDGRRDRGLARHAGARAGVHDRPARAGWSRHPERAGLGREIVMSGSRRRR